MADATPEQFGTTPGNVCHPRKFFLCFSFYYIIVVVKEKSPEIMNELNLDLCDILHTHPFDCSNIDFVPRDSSRVILPPPVAQAWLQACCTCYFKAAFQCIDFSADLSVPPTPPFSIQGLEPNHTLFHRWGQATRPCLLATPMKTPGATPRQGWRQDFSDGGLTLPTRGLKYGFQGTINAKNLRKNCVSPSDGGLACSDGGYSPQALPWRHPCPRDCQNISTCTRPSKAAELLSIAAVFQQF